MMPFPTALAAQDSWTPWDWQSKWRNRPRHVVQEPLSPCVAVFYWVSLRIWPTFFFPARVEQSMYNGVPPEEAIGLTIDGKLNKMKIKLLFALALFFLATGVAFAAASITLDQCANGPLSAPLPCTGAQWQNGNINPQNSHYTENESSPYRAILNGMTVGDIVTVRIQYAFTTSYLHTHDFLTSWDHTATGDPCSSQPCFGTTPTTLAIPTDTVLASCPTPPTGPGVPQQPGVFAGYGISLTNAVYVGTHPCQGQTVDVTMDVSFKVLTTDAVLAWGGHIAQQNDWGIGQSASSLSGSPYHMRILDWTYKNVGNQDRSMQIAPAPTAVRVTFFGGEADAPHSSALPIIALGLLAGTAITIWAMKQ